MMSARRLHRLVTVSRWCAIPARRKSNWRPWIRWSKEDGHPRRTTIKIDVEGHELEVLRGAARTLVEKRPVVVCDQNDGATMSKIEHYLRPLGYVVTPGPPIVAVHGSP